MRTSGVALLASVFCLCSKQAIALPWPTITLPWSQELTSQAYQNTIKLDGLLTHARKWQEFANRANGTRSFGTPGYQLSADYVYNLAKWSGYKVTRQGVKYPQSTIYSQDLLIDTKQFATGEVIAFSYSPPTPKAGITSELVLIPDGPSAATGAGCDAADYAGLNVTGKIAFISRGSCTFAIKSTLAKNAGAAAAIIYNNVAGGAFSSRISYNVSESVPTVIIGLETAQPFVTRLNGTGTTITATVKVDSLIKDVISENIIAQTIWGNQSNVIHIGAHLDSVPAGPGVNDDGSGSATVAELLVQLVKFRPSKNAVRFSWWTNEEIGLVGSQYYVDSLSAAEKAKIALYINLDMTASPNYIYGIHDGDGSSGSNSVTPPPGSAALEKLFQDDFESKKLPWASYAFSGSSDYDAFLKAGIPAGGLATGAGGLKTAAQAATFGGEAGVAFDKCYHAACDTIDNLAKDALLVNARSVAHVIATTAKSTALIDAQSATQPKAKQAAGGFGLVDLGFSCRDHHEEL